MMACQGIIISSSLPKAHPARSKRRPAAGALDSTGWACGGGAPAAARLPATPAASTSMARGRMAVYAGFEAATEPHCRRWAAPARCPSARGGVGPAQLDFTVCDLKPISKGHSFRYGGAPYKCLYGGGPYKSPKIAENRRKSPKIAEIPSLRPTSEGHSYYHRP